MFQTRFVFNAQRTMLLNVHESFELQNIENSCIMSAACYDSNVSREAVRVSLWFGAAQASSYIKSTRKKRVVDRGKHAVVYHTQAL